MDLMQFWLMSLVVYLLLYVHLHLMWSSSHSGFQSKHVLSSTEPPSAPVNLTVHHHNDSVLIMTWDPPHDSGGRQEVMYYVKCEKKAEADNRWGACGDDVVFLPDSARLTNTSVSISRLNPQCDYRLSVQAWNDISTLQGAPPSSTATVTMHRCT